MKHGPHTIDEYLDDKDFLTLCDDLEYGFRHIGCEAEDFDEKSIIDDIDDYVQEFAQSICDDFGWKYGENRNTYSTAEKIAKELKKRFENK